MKGIKVSKMLITRTFIIYSVSKDGDLINITNKEYLCKTKIC